MFTKYKTVVVCGLAVMSVGSVHAKQNTPLPIRALSVADKQHLLHDTFVVVKTVKAIPKSVQNELNGMVDPNQPFQSTDVVIGSKPLPGHRLIFAALSKGYCLVYNEYGGIAYGTQVSWYHVSGDRASLVWKAYIKQGNPDQTWPVLQGLIAKGKYY